MARQPLHCTPPDNGHRVMAFTIVATPFRSAISLLTYNQLQTSNMKAQVNVAHEFRGAFCVRVPIDNLW